MYSQALVQQQFRPIVVFPESVEELAGLQLAAQQFGKRALRKQLQ
jgi:hypothetical protein